MKESKLQAEIIRAVNDAGGLAVKTDPCNCFGFPDLIIFLPDFSQPIFIECKTQSGRVRPAQQKMIKDLKEKYGQHCFVVRNKRDFINCISFFIPREKSDDE